MYSPILGLDKLKLPGVVISELILVDPGISETVMLGCFGKVDGMAVFVIVLIAKVVNRPLAIVLNLFQ